MRKTKLYKHQQEVLEQTRDFKNVGYFLDMGLGKTFVGSEKAVSFQKTIIVVCQKSKIKDWIMHFILNYPDVGCYDLTDKEDFEKFIQIDKVRDTLPVAVINYDLIWRRKELLKLDDFVLMLDESSLIQNRTSKRSKFILKMQPSNVILLSGTPVGGKYENLWTQIHLLGWNISEKLYNKQYINWGSINIGGINHLIVDKNNPYKNVDRLKNKMREYGSVFMKTEEVIDLPKQTFTVVKCDAPKEYKKFMKNRIVTINDTELVGDTTLTKMLYARQLCSQYNKDKLEAFKDLLESTNDRLIVFYNFTAELDAMLEIAYQCKPISIVNGSTKDLLNYERYDNSITFVQYQAGAKGLNLQKANKIIYFSLTLSSEDFEQSKKRIHRIGQEKPCFYYIMLSTGSIEWQIYNTLKERKNYTDELFRKELKT